MLKLNENVDIAQMESQIEQEKKSKSKKGNKQDLDAFESERSANEPDANEGNYLDRDERPHFDD